MTKTTTTTGTSGKAGTTNNGLKPTSWNACSNALGTPTGSSTSAVDLVATPSTTSSELTTPSSLTTPCTTSSTPQKTSQQRLSAATFFSFVPTSTAYLLLMGPSIPGSSSGSCTILS